MVETGFFENGLPYARIGQGSKIIVNLEALSFKHEPPSGFMLKEIEHMAKFFGSEYTILQVGRRQNVPETYSFEEMASDYADFIRREFQRPVIIMGTSTGGQIAQFLAAGHSDVVEKLVLISTAFQLSPRGKEIEGKARDYFQQKRYGRCMVEIMNLIFDSKIQKMLFVPLMLIFGKLFMGKISFPNDAICEFNADISMNFLDRLHEIKASALIISGELDIDYDVNDVKKTAEGIPNSHFIIVPQVGHNLMIKKSKMVYEEVKKFINTNSC